MKAVSRIALLACTLLLPAFLLVGCGQEKKAHYQPRPPVKLAATHAGKYPIQVVCTVGMVADLVREVGGPHVQVTQLMGEGVDPHLYKATPDDIRKLSDADVIFYSGLHLEGKMTEIFEQMSARRPVFAVAEYLDAPSVLGDEKGHPDPHVWFDVSLWNKARGVVQEVLRQYDPKNAAEYQQRGDAYQATLAKLHGEVREQLAVIPKSLRVMVTAHDAFSYFGKAYDIEVKGMQGVSTESEASVKHVNELVAYLTERKIKAIFVETSVNDRNMKALIEGCAARSHKVEISDTPLFSDAMGKDGTPEGTYVGMVRHNVKALVKALR